MDKSPVSELAAVRPHRPRDSWFSVHMVNNSQLRKKVLGSLLLGILLGTSLSILIIITLAPNLDLSSYTGLKDSLQEFERWIFCTMLLPGIGFLIGTISLGTLTLVVSIRADQSTLNRSIYIEIISASALGGILGGAISLLLPLSSPCYLLYLQ
jgi:Na+/H+ antiporter NhaA